MKSVFSYSPFEKVSSVTPEEREALNEYYNLRYHNEPEFKEKFKQSVYNSRKKNGRVNEIRNTKLKNYGLTLKKFNELINSQNNSCAICKKPFNEVTACIDHDHQTGKVRGLLCPNCNWALGHAKDNIKILESMIRYLQCT